MGQDARESGESRRRGHAFVRAFGGGPRGAAAALPPYGRRLAWDPFLRVARLAGADEPGVGMRAWCVACYGLGMETEYVSYRPPEVVAVRMTRGPCLLRRFAGSWRFREVAPGVTRVTSAIIWRAAPLAARRARSAADGDLRPRHAAPPRRVQARIETTDIL